MYQLYIRELYVLFWYTFFASDFFPIELTE
jgi:hypothetical protein